MTQQTKEILDFKGNLDNDKKVTVLVTEKWQSRKKVTEKLHKVTISAPVVAQAEMPQISQPINQQQPSMSSAATCPNQDFRLGLEGGSFL